MQPKCGMGGETPSEYSEMEDLHFQKFVTEFPFLTGVLALCFENCNPKVHRLSVSRIGPELLKSNRDFGFPTSEEGSSCSENYSCDQLFAVKVGIVGELQIVDPMDYVYIGLGQYQYSPYEEPDYGWDDDYEDIDDEGPEYEKWPVLRALKGDEEYLVLVKYHSWEEEETSDEFSLPHGTGRYFYSRSITVYKAAKHGTPTENLERWQELERDENTRAYNRWDAHQQEGRSSPSLN